jgi:hypothetical protein
MRPEHRGGALRRRVSGPRGTNPLLMNVSGAPTRKTPPHSGVQNPIVLCWSGIVLRCSSTTRLDGVDYWSVFNGGKNPALFDLGSAEQKAGLGSSAKATVQ